MNPALRILAVLVAALPAATAEGARPVWVNDGSRRIEVAPGQLQVRFSDPAHRDSALGAAGAGVVHRGSDGTFLVRAADAGRVKEQLAQNPHVAWVSWNPVCRAGGIAEQEAKIYDLPGLGWNFDAIGLGRGQSLLDLIPAPKPITVAVVDSGLRYLDGAPGYGFASVVPGWDFVQNDAVPQDENGHGTHVASIIGGRGTLLPGAYVGAAAGVTLMPVRVLDASLVGTEYAVTQGIRWAADNGAQVINLSLNFPESYVASPAMREAVSYAAGRALLVGSSGNAGGKKVLYPAAFRQVIAVGAVRPEVGGGYVKADYSNSGTALEMVAPGGSHLDDVNADSYPDAILGLSFDRATGSGDGYWFMTGTSQAAAHASAAVAAVLAAGAPAKAARKIVVDTARDLGTAGFDTGTGAGLLEARAAVLKALTDYAVPRVYHVDAAVALLRVGGAVGLVQVLDESALPAAGLTVVARWRGAYVGVQQALTDAQGIARFQAPAGSAKVYALLVAAILDNAGRPIRPHGFGRGTGLADSTAIFGWGDGLADSTLFGGWDLGSGFTVRTIDLFGTLTPGAAAFDLATKATLGGGLADSTALAWGDFYFNNGSLYSFGMGLADSTLFGAGLADSTLFGSGLADSTLFGSAASAPERLSWGDEPSLQQAILNAEGSGLADSTLFGSSILVTPLTAY